jgi:hypothetical protein
MATARVIYAEPVSPPVKNITLSLTHDEANALYTVLSNVAVSGIGKTTYHIFVALQDTKAVKRAPGIPVVKADDWLPLITFKS